MEPVVSLVRRWAVDWLASADPDACDAILAADYSILIGGFRLEPRERYIAETLKQLNRFPGLGLTIHELMTDGNRVAVRFTEHGAAVSLEGRPAAWGGVALFRSEDGRLSACWTEENYLGRRRQLDSGVADQIEAPATAPWNTVKQAANPAAEAVVRDWLGVGGFAGVDLDDGWLGYPVERHLDDVEVELNEMFSAGDRVAFHGRLRGRFTGGLDNTDRAIGSLAELHIVGLVTVTNAEVTGGRVVRDRLGLQRSLATGAR
jgi:hypothetical protein